MAPFIKLKILCIILFAIILVSCDGPTDQTEEMDVPLNQLYNDLSIVQDELFSKMKLFEKHITTTDRDELVKFFSKESKDYAEFTTLIGMEKAKYHDLLQLIEDHDQIAYKIKEINDVSESELKSKSMKAVSNDHAGSNFDLKDQVSTYLNYLEQRSTYSCTSNLSGSQIIYANNFEMMNEDEDGSETQVQDEASFWNSECSWQASACTIVAGGAATACGMFAPICFGAGAALCFCEFCSGDWVDANC